MTDQPIFVPISHVIQPYDHAQKDPADASRRVVGVPVVALPPGWSVHGLKDHFEAYLSRPDRRVGSLTLKPDSFINYVKRYKNDDSTVAFYRKRLFGGYGITVVFNTHPPGAEESLTGFGDFMAFTQVKNKHELDMIKTETNIIFFEEGMWS